MGRLVILDPALRRRAGHHFNYAAALLDACRQREMDFIAFGNGAVEPSVSEAIPVRPAFRVDTYQALENPNIPKHTYDGLRAHEWTSAMAVSCFLMEDLRQIEPHLRPDDIIFFHTLNHAQFLGLAQWLGTSGAAASLRLRFVFLLRFWHPFRSIVAPFFKLAATALTAGPADVRFCSDTFELSVAYAEMTGAVIDTVAIPHTAEEPVASDAPAAAPVISYLGHPRVEKGSHFLVDIVEAVIRTCPEAKFVLQQSPPGDGGDMLARLMALQAAYPQRIELVDSDLSREDYNRHLAGSDIVLLSYDPGSYRYRSSGVFIEAAAAGKIAVIPARSSMHTEAQRFRCAAVTFQNFSANAIADATVKAVRARDQLRPVGQEARRAVLAYHNAGTLLNYLTAPAD